MNGLAKLDLLMQKYSFFAKIKNINSIANTQFSPFNTYSTVHNVFLSMSKW